MGAVTGLGGTGAGSGAILLTQTTGFVVDHFHSYTPVLVTAGLLPVIGTARAVSLGRAHPASVVRKVRLMHELLGSDRQGGAGDRRIVGHRRRHGRSARRPRREASPSATTTIRRAPNRCVRPSPLRAGRLIAIRADVRKAAEIQTLVDRTSHELGPIDILVNNAGSLVNADAHQGRHRRGVGRHHEPEPQERRAVLAGRRCRQWSSANEAPSSTSCRSPGTTAADPAPALCRGQSGADRLHQIAGEGNGSARRPRQCRIPRSDRYAVSRGLLHSGNDRDFVKAIRMGAGDFEECAMAIVSGVRRGELSGCAVNGGQLML